jgi:diamine N-acetyltransferase
MISIRYVNSDEAPLIADMSRKTFYDTFASFNTAADMEKFMAVQFSREMLINEVGQGGSYFLLASYGNEPAGYAKLKEGETWPAFHGKSAIEITRIYALTEMIGKGIGAALMQASIDHAVKAGKQIIWLGVWEKNEKAIAFYQRWGFVKFGEHDFLLGDDLQHDWLLMKTL